MTQPTIQQRLASAGIELIEQPTPRHSYVPLVRDGNVLYLSGKTPMREGAVVYAGVLDSEADVDRGREAARLCIVNLLSTLDSAVGLGEVESILKVTGFVASTDRFTLQPQVINAASDLLVAVLGDAGSHARSAVGVSSLPGGSSVEIEAIVRVRDEGTLS